MGLLIKYYPAEAIVFSHLASLVYSGSRWQIYILVSAFVKVAFFVHLQLLPFLYVVYMHEDKSVLCFSFYLVNHLLIVIPSVICLSYSPSLIKSSFIFCVQVLKPIDIKPFPGLWHEDNGMRRHQGRERLECFSSISM